ncbi:STAS domain-containing protein [Rhodococcus sp. NPDC003994]
MTVSTIASDPRTTVLPLSDGTLTVSRTDTTTTYRVGGSIDLANAADLRDALRDAPAEDVVLDLTAVDFFGTAALTVVAALDVACEDRGSRLTLRVGDAVARVMGAARWEPSAHVVDVRG